VTVAKIFPPGTRVTLDDPDYGPWYGRVVVCLCKRHVWQPVLLDRECGHERCGHGRGAAACPWPMHVVWRNGNESHQGMDGLAAVTTP
jgi:hypothetical protein